MQLIAGKSVRQHPRTATWRNPWLVTGLTLIGSILFLLSLWQPWWGLEMFAPQYPGGLVVISDLTQMTGDVEEINTLNHYIGLMPVDQAAQLERKLAPGAVWFFTLLALAAVLTARSWLMWLLRLPLIIFPLLFLVSLKAWLWYAGNHLDPAAPLSATIKAFTPVMLGPGKIAQFETYGWVEPGFWLATAGAVLVLAGGLLQTLHRRGAD